MDKDSILGFFFLVVCCGVLILLTALFSTDLQINQNLNTLNRTSSQNLKVQEGWQAWEMANKWTPGIWLIF